MPSSVWAAIILKENRWESQYLPHVVIFLHPRQDKPVPDGMVESGSIELSNDAKTWHPAGDFKFGNLLNNPSQRTFRLSKRGSARYLRFTSKTGAQGKPYGGAAEIGVLSQ